MLQLDWLVGLYEFQIIVLIFLPFILNFFLHNTNFKTFKLDLGLQCREGFFFVCCVALYVSTWFQSRLMLNLQQIKRHVHFESIGEHIERCIMLLSCATCSLIHVIYLFFFRIYSNKHTQKKSVIKPPANDYCCQVQCINAASFQVYWKRERKI